jgi:exopolyphosphatase/guanosine-5'-triphosphate,3'-diphosphate pyrophosphatase
MTRVAAIDCGTNSIRLLIADVAEGQLVDVLRTMTIVRLGEGIDRTGRFAPAALERTFAATREFADLIAKHQAARVRFCATSASRDAANKAELIEGITAILGIAPEIIPGEEEASLSFIGATGDLPQQGGPFLVIDIGGGSTEFVLGGSQVEAAISVDIGCVRMTERHMRSDPPTPDEVIATTRDVDSAIDRALSVVPAHRMRSLVAVAGTATTIAAAALDLDSYRPEVIHGSVIAREQVQAVRDRFLSMNRAERATLPYMHPGRVDVIAAGSVVLARIMERLDAEEVTVSEHDILDGIALSLASDVAR